MANMPPIEDVTVVDFHTHILPGMDDGSQSVEESLQMLQKEAEQGIDTVFCTPHFYPNEESLQEFCKRRQTAIEQLQHAVAEQANLPALHFGAELAYYENMSRSVQLPLLCVSDTNILLIELPFCAWNGRVFHDITQIAQSGMHPLIAHIERYLPMQPKPKQALQDLRNAGAYIQSNAGFFLHGWRSFQAFHMLKRQEIDVLGSDCHNLTTRQPNLLQATQKIERKLGAQVLENIREKENFLLRQTAVGIK